MNQITSQSAANSDSEATAVRLTEAAAKRICELARAEGETKDAKLRISVDGGGCSGFSYRFSMDRNVQDDDIVVERDGATLLVDKISLEILGGSEVDFVEDLQASSFRVNNPKAISTCGCGTSFSI